MIDFPKGIRWVTPHEKAPEFVKGKISIKVSEFVDYIQANQSNDWINFSVKKSKKDTIYLELDTWKPKDKPTNDT